MTITDPEYYAQALRERRETVPPRPREREGMGRADLLRPVRGAALQPPDPRRRRRASSGSLRAVCSLRALPGPRGRGPAVLPARAREAVRIRRRASGGDAAGASAAWAAFSRPSAGRCSRSACSPGRSAFILSGEMAVAYFRSWAPRGFFPIANGGEEATLNAFIFLWLVAAGAGAFSLDASDRTPATARSVRSARRLVGAAGARPAARDPRLPDHAARHPQGVRGAAVGGGAPRRAAARARFVARGDRLSRTGGRSRC